MADVGEASASAQINSSLSWRILRTLPGDSVAVAIRTCLQAVVGSTPFLRPWTEGNSGLLFHKQKKLRSMR